MEGGYEALGVRKEKDVGQTGSEPEKGCNGFGYRVFSYIQDRSHPQVVRCPNLALLLEPNSSHYRASTPFEPIYIICVWANPTAPGGLQG